MEKKKKKNAKENKKKRKSFLSIKKWKDLMESYQWITLNMFN